MLSSDESEDDIELRKRGLFPLETEASVHVPPAKKGLRSTIVDGACILLNIASTVVLVFLNKWYLYLRSPIVRTGLKRPMFLNSLMPNIGSSATPN
jgi:hypothetical protein